MSHVLVSGATGFIGMHTCEHLVESGIKVTALVRAGSETGKLAAIGVSDILSRETVQEKQLAALDLDGMIHCAAAYGRDKDRQSDLLDVNVAYPLWLLDLAKSMGTTCFIYLDTCFKLDYPYLRSYTLSKKQMVQWGRLTANDDAVRFINLQLQHPFGPGDRKGKFVPWIVDQCLRNAEVELTSGEQAKDFIYVSDVASAVTCLVRKHELLEPGFHEFECGRGRGVTVRSFVETIHRLSGSESTLRFGALPTRPNEVMLSEANIDPLTTLGWNPIVGLEEGVMQTIESQRDGQS